MIIMLTKSVFIKQIVFLFVIAIQKYDSLKIEWQ